MRAVSVHAYTGERGSEERESESESESERECERARERARARERGEERDRATYVFAHTGGSRKKNGCRLRVLDVARACSIGADLVLSHSFTHTLDTLTRAHERACARTHMHVRSSCWPSLKRMHVGSAYTCANRMGVSGSKIRPSASWVC